MSNRLVFCFVPLVALLVMGPARSRAGWDLVWQDEFEGAALDTVKWFAETTNSPHNNELQAYRPQQVTVVDGNLTITAENIPLGGKQYRSGRIHSNYTQEFGRWEVRADLPTTRGMWPAIWLLPNTSQTPWPSGGEIDILENRGNQPNLTSSAFHYGANFQQHQYKFSEQTMARFGEPVNFHEGFHTYAVEWDQKKLRFFVDDVHYYTIFNADVGGFLTNSTAPMWTVLNVAVGGDFLPPPDATTIWPQKMQVDYVRIFDPTNAPVRFKNSGFDAADGSLGGWSVFGNKLNANNVSVHNEAVADGPASLKLFGQFTAGTNTSGVSQGITVAAGDEVRASIESFIRAQDSLQGTGNVVRMKLEFYNDFGGKHGTSAFLDEEIITIADAASPNDIWRTHQLSAVAPTGAVEARLALVFSQVSSGQGAIHFDNASFLNMRVAVPGDADGDGEVGATDLQYWSRQFGATASQAADFDTDGDADGTDLLVWQSGLGGVALGESSDSGIETPEPWGVAIALAAFARLIRAAAL